MMVFDILASHHRMTIWHDASLDQQMAALAKLRDAKRACHVRLRKQHSLTKRLSFDAIMGLADLDSSTPAQDLISAAVRLKDAVHSDCRLQADAGDCSWHWPMRYLAMALLYRDSPIRCCRKIQHKYLLLLP